MSELTTRLLLIATEPGTGEIAADALRDAVARVDALEGERASLIAAALDHRATASRALGREQDARAVIAQAQQEVNGLMDSLDDSVIADDDERGRVTLEEHAALCGEIEQLKDRLAAHEKLGLAAIFLADTIGASEVDREKERYDAALRAEALEAVRRALRAEFEPLTTRTPDWHNVDRVLADGVADYRKKASV